MAKSKRSRPARETVEVKVPIPKGFGDAEFRELLGPGKSNWRVPVRPASGLLRGLVARTWHEATGGAGVTLDGQGREIPPAGDQVSADDEGQS